MIEQLLTVSTSSEVVREVKFLDEVATTDLINGEELADRIGLTAGTAQHSTEPWLHFILDDVELYIAKKPYRHSVNWDQINAVDAVFGDKTIVINGKTYKVRLLKSVATDDTYTGSTGIYDPVEAYGSEWNRLMYPIHSGNHTSISNPSSVSGERIRLGTLAQYADSDLLVHYSGSNGSFSWCQETPSRNTGSRVCRGFHGVSYLNWRSASQVSSNNGWRPVLELVE